MRFRSQQAVRRCCGKWHTCVLWMTGLASSCGSGGQCLSLCVCVCVYVVGPLGIRQVCVRVFDGGGLGGQGSALTQLVL
jgi:hypothetical protein